MRANRRFDGPRRVSEAIQMSRDMVAPLQGFVSGEITTNKGGVIIGSSPVAGKITKVWFSLESGGVDAAQNLGVSADVKIAGTTCLTTDPAYLRTAGAGSRTAISTVSTGTGITQGVVNTGANTVAPGNLITCDLTVTRTATPTYEMKGFVMVVEFEPV